MAKAFLEREYEGVVARKATPPAEAPDVVMIDADDEKKEVPAEPQPKVEEEVMEEEEEEEEEEEAKPNIPTTSPTSTGDAAAEDMKKEDADDKGDGLLSTAQEPQSNDVPNGERNIFDSMLDNPDGGPNEFDLHLDGDLGNQDLHAL